MNKIKIIVDKQTNQGIPYQTEKGAPLGLLDDIKGAFYTAKEFDSDKLKESLANLTTQLNTLFADIKQVGAFQLQQVQIQVEISAEGEILLIGKAGVKGAVTLTFSPPVTPQPFTIPLDQTVKALLEALKASTEPPASEK